MYHFTTDEWNSFFILILTTSSLFFGCYQLGQLCFHKLIIKSGMRENIIVFPISVITGMLLIFSILNLINFVHKIHQPYAFYILSSFSIFGLIKLFKYGQINIILMTVFLNATFTILIFQNFVHWDFHLYHGLTIEWLLQEKTPFGLVNLNHRLGFNSAVNIIQTLIVVPDWHERTYVSSTVWGYSLYTMTIITILNCFNQYNRIILVIISSVYIGGLVFHNIVYATGGVDIPTSSFVLIGFLFFILSSFHNNISVKSFPALLLLIASISSFLLASMGRPIYILFVLMSFSCYILYFYKIPIRTLTTYLSLPILAGVIWCTKNVIITGCLAYPAAFTCFHSLSWTPDSESIELMRKTILGFAREPGNSIGASTGWQWLPSYFSRQLDSIYVQSIGPAIISIIIFALWHHFTENRNDYSRNKKHKNYRYLAFGTASICLLGWFFTGPDFRFGWPIFVILVLILTLKFYDRNDTPKLQSVSSVSVAMIFSIVILISHFGIQKRIFVRPLELQKQHVELTNVNGIKIYKPSRSNFCGIRILMCSIHENVYAEKMGGRYLFRPIN